MGRLIPVRPAGDAVQLARVKAIQGFHSAWRQRPGLAPMRQCGADAYCVEAQFQLARCTARPRVVGKALSHSGQL